MKLKLVNKIYNKSLFWGIALLGLLFIFITFGSVFTKYNFTAQNLQESIQPPTSTHILGTDYYGRDVFARLVYGGRMTWTIAITTAVLAIFIGIFIGLFTAYIGGWFDVIVMRFVDIMLAFPKLFVILLIIGLGASSIPSLIITLALFSWMEITRIARAEVMSVINITYVKSAKALGLGTFRILFKHIFPNIIGPIIVSSVLLIATIILVESSLSFLGIGIRPPGASWGTILNEGKIDPLGTWWLSIPAGLLILLTVTGFNLIGDGLQKHFNPKKSF